MDGLLNECRSLDVDTPDAPEYTSVSFNNPFNSGDLEKCLRYVILIHLRLEDGDAFSFAGSGLLEEELFAKFQ